MNWNDEDLFTDIENSIAEGDFEMRNDLQRLILAGTTLVLVPEDLDPETEGVAFNHYIEWLEEEAESVRASAEMDLHGTPDCRD